MSDKKAPLKKKKVPKFAEIKKPLTIGGIVAAIAIAGIIIGINLAPNHSDHQDVVLIYGTTQLLHVIDPLNVMDMSEINVITQFAEGLFDIDVTTPNLDVIDGLAIHSEWSPDALNLTCILRQDVKFHDGTPFNATAVKWNFDRIYGLRNNLSYHELWHLPDDRFLINETQVLDDYTVRFVLNSPFVPFKNLLTSWTSFILSPTSTPKDSFINVNETNPIGTGPFKFDSCAWKFVESENDTLAVNVTMSANQNYWGGKPEIDKLIFLRFFSKLDLLEALRLRKVHLIIGSMTGSLTESELSPFKSNSSFIVHEGIPNGFLNWLTINNELINVTMRKAISYAFNYSSIIETTMADDRRAKSPLPERTKYYNITDIEIPFYNVPYARQILKDGNWPGTALLTANDNISTGNEWELIANSSTPLATYNISHVPWWSTEHIEEQLVEDLKQIGVKIEIVNITYYEWVAMGYEWPPYHKNMINFAYNFWIADYNDPNNYINTFYHNSSVENWGQVYDPQAQVWMEETLIEIDPIKRRNLYYDIQKRLIEEVYPSLWLTNSFRIDIYVSNLRDWYPNFIRLSLKTVYFE